MTANEIRAAYNGGDTPWEILAALVHAGVEYPDAEWKVISALHLDSEEAEEMADRYTNCA